MATTKKDKPNAAAKAKLKRFLKKGHPDDIASVLVQTLMHRAEVAAKVQQDLLKDEGDAPEDKK